MKKVLVYEIVVEDDAQEQLLIAEMESVLGMKPTRIEEREE
ncbi:hypothetical protein [Alistipes putredinis]